MLNSRRLVGWTPTFRSPKHAQHVWASVVLVILMSFGFWWANYSFSSSVQTLSEVSATSERVAFDVTQPRLAAFYVRAMRIGTSTNALKGCIEGLVTPALNSRVIYGRVGYGPLSIELWPPGDGGQENATAAAFAAGGGDKEVSLGGRIYMETDGGCDPLSVKATPLPLPIWGRASIGSEFAGAEGAVPTPRLLLEGKLRFSARAVNLNLLSLRPTLYSVTALELPVGSRLEAFSTAPQAEQQDVNGGKKAGDRSQKVNWWGTAYVHYEETALIIAIAPDEARLALYRPNTHDPDVIEATMLTQIFDDPNLIKIYKLLAVIGGCGALGGWLVSAFKKREKGTANQEGARTT